MEFYQKLPRNKKEFALFIVIISVISVNIIAPLITCFEIGFGMNSWAAALKGVPFIWLCVVALVLITYKPAEFLTHKLTQKGDSFKSVMIINALCTVAMMAMFLTVIGSWIGSRHISVEPIVHFFYRYPRNFGIALAVETLIAQPFARFVIKTLHGYLDNRTEETVC